MTDAYIVDAVRTAGGKRDGTLKEWHPVSTGRRSARRAGCTHRHRPVGDRRRDRRLRQPDRRAELSRRPQHGARLFTPRHRPRRDHRPPVRLLAAVDPLRRAGGDERDAGPGHRCRRREHDPRADGHAGVPADAGGDRQRPVAASDPGPLRSHRVHPVPRRRDDGQEIRHSTASSSIAFALDSHRKAAAATRAGAFDARDRAAEGRRRRASPSTKAFAPMRRSRRSPV